MTEGDAAEGLYREAIERLGRPRGCARSSRAAQLLYGEWLRRRVRRVGRRRAQLRSAHALLAAIGMEAFASAPAASSSRRARRYAGAPSSRVTSSTPQERQIAGLARDGLSNPEIGARLFISPRTVEWHLKKVFTKLGIGSRMGLHNALPSREFMLRS